MADAPETKRTWRIPERLRLELLAALSSQPDQVDTMTYEEFLEWADEDTHAEWVEGRVEMPSPASLRHQEIQTFLLELVSLFVKANGLGSVVPAPFQMRLARSGREPDLLFVANEHLDRLKATYLDGAADLVVEIVSPESGARDYGNKLIEYREGGVPEYWIIDPALQQADFYRLDAKGRYQPAPEDTDGIYHSQAIPGFWLDVNWLWQEPLPNVIRAMKRIDPAAYARYAGE